MLDHVAQSGYGRNPYLNSHMAPNTVALLSAHSNGHQYSHAGVNQQPQTLNGLAELPTHNTAHFEGALPQSDISSGAPEQFIQDLQRQYDSA